MTDSNIAPEEEIDLDKTQLEVMRKQTAMLERYEGKIQTLLQDRLDGNISDDDYSEQQDELRKIFLREFQDLYSEVDQSTPELHFRKVLYKASMDQVKRYFGYYTAMVDINNKIVQYNMELNEQVLSFESQDVLTLIGKLEHVKMTIAMVEALEIPKKQAQQIVDLTIVRLFGVRH